MSVDQEQVRTAVSSHVRRRPRRSALARERAITGIVFVVPATVLVTAFIFVPLAQAVYRSMTAWDGVTSTFVGLRNYTQLLAQPVFWQLVRNNGLILLSIPIGVAASFVVAYLLSLRIPFTPIFRAVLFLPAALSWVVVALISRAFFGPEGQLNWLLRSVGMAAAQHDWLGDQCTALIAVIVTFTVAVFGVNTTILLAGMATIDKSTIEAARVDGAGGYRVLRDVVAPASAKFISVVLLITVVQAFTGLFGLIYVMTGGGPGYSTTTLEFSIYQFAFATGDFGLAAALGIVLFLAVGAVVALRGLVFLSRRAR